MVARAWTAERFAAEKFDLQDGGRWFEIEAGELIALEPPEALHGTAVLNLSRELGRYLQEHRNGYACYELGLVVRRAPDTVRVPAISYFADGPAFAEFDAVVTESRPALVVEVPSTPGRRRTLQERILEYRSCGIPFVLVLDTENRCLQFHGGTSRIVRLNDDDTFETSPDWIVPDTQQPLLPGFSITVRSIFAEPDWWQHPRRPQ